MKSILITGAGKGIGFALVKLALENGHTVFALSRNCSQLEGLSESFPHTLHILPVDLLSPNLEEECAHHVFSTVPTLDCLINNAGLLINKPFSQLTDSDWNDLFQTNVMGAVKLIRICLPHFADNAHIVNISSMGGYQGSAKFPGLSAYSSTKAALSVLTECLVAEPEFSRLKCNALCLGAVQTEMLNEAFPGYTAPVSTEEMAEFILDFALKSGRVMSGKIIPVSITDPVR